MATVTPMGLEPNIPALKGRKTSSGRLFCDDRSETETCVLTFRLRGLNAPHGIRTHDLLVKSQILYPPVNGA